MPVPHLPAKGFSRASKLKSSAVPFRVPWLNNPDPDLDEIMNLCFSHEDMKGVQENENQRKTFVSFVPLCEINWIAGFARILAFRFSGMSFCGTCST
jgi:hypothetical protein